LLDSGATVHVISDPRLLDERYNEAPPLDMNQLDTASRPLNVECMSALVMKLKDQRGQSFFYRAPCLYVPDLQSDQLLSYSQMATCPGCEISCKCASQLSLSPTQILSQVVTTRDAKNRLRKFETVNENGLFHIEYEICTEEEKNALTKYNGASCLEFQHLSPTQFPNSNVVSKQTILSRNKCEGLIVRSNPISPIDEAGFLHGVLGDTSSKRIKEAFELGGLKGKTFGTSELRATFEKDCAQFECAACAKSNKRGQTTPKVHESRCQTKPFHLMHADIAYLVNDEAEKKGALDNFMPDEPPPLYALVMVDDASRWTFVRPLYKKDAQSIIDAFISIENDCRAMVARMLNDANGAAIRHGFSQEELDNKRISIIKHIHTDNDASFRGTFGVYEGPERYRWSLKELEKMNAFDNNPIWSHSESHKQHQNGVVERKIGDLKQHALRVRAAAGIGPAGRFYSLHYCAYNLNLVSTQIHGEKDTPFHYLFQRAYDVTTRPLRAFGSLGFKRLYNQPKGTMPREPVIFLTYPSFPKRGYIVSEVFKGKLGGIVANCTSSDLITRDWAWIKTPIQITIKVLEDFTQVQVVDVDTGQANSAHQLNRSVDELPRSTVILDNTRDDSDDEFEDAHSYFSDEDSDDDSFDSALNNFEVENDDTAQSQMKAMTVKVTGASFAYAIEKTKQNKRVVKCFHGKRVQTSRPTFQRTGKHSIVRVKPKVMAIRIGKEGEKTKQIEDFSEEEWKRAEMDEWVGFVNQKVLKLDFCPRGTRKLDFKAVKKVRNDNSLKVRLTVRGFKQTKNVNYFNKYSPVVSPSVIRSVIVTAVSMGLPLWAADIKQAFLQARISEDIWVDIPKGYDYDKSKGNAFKLLKSVYGSMQASRNWFNTLRDALLSCNFSQSRKEPCLFYKVDENDEIKMVVTTLVDDILALGSEERWNEFIEELGKKVELEQGSISEAKEYCGITLRRVDKHRLELSQDRYTLEMIEKHAKTSGWQPRNASVPLRKQDADHLLDPMLESIEGEDEHVILNRTEKYQSLLGSLLWLAIWTRCDISFAVGLAGRRAKRPSKEHLVALENILSYVSTNQHMPLVYDCNDCKGRLSLSAFSDSDYAGDKERFKSTTGYAVMLSGCLISWSSKLQSVVSLSTAQAETNAAVDCLREVKFHSHILNEMGIHQSLTPILIDNRATIDRMMRNTPTPTTKHEGIRSSWLHEAAMDEEVVWPFFVNTEENIADMFTKGTLKGGIPQFHKLRDRLMGRHGELAEGTAEYIKRLLNVPGSLALDSKIPDIHTYFERRGTRLFMKKFGHMLMSESQLRVPTESAN